MHSTTSRRSGGIVPAFTLIELLVVVAIIALLISILLPSLSKARDQAKAAVCASRVRSFSQAALIYETDEKSFPLVDPWPVVPYCSSGSTDTVGDCRSAGSGEQIWDPAIGRLAIAMGINPEIPSSLPQTIQDWESFAWGFYMQSTQAPETLWEGFWCPSQDHRNTHEDDSPEIDFGGPSNGQWWVQVRYKYASAYQQNRLIRSPVRDRDLGPKPSDYNANLDAGVNDNIFSTPHVSLSNMDYPTYFLQGSNSTRITMPADCVYMSDTSNFLIDGVGDQPTDDRYRGFPSTSNKRTAGQIICSTWGTASVIGARHLGTGNVGYLDGHVSRENQVPRNKRGQLVIASTFADYIEEDSVGTQHHLMPCWRRYR